MNVSYIHLAIPVFFLLIGIELLAARFLERRTQTGGIRVEEIEDPLMKKVRWLDKLIDELANGKAMEKILRK